MNRSLRAAKSWAALTLSHRSSSINRRKVLLTAAYLVRVAGGGNSGN